LTTLFELETRVGDWRAAADTLGRAQRSKAIPAPQAQRHEAAVLIELSRAALANGRGRDALRAAEQAHRADPDHLAATIWLAERYVEADKPRAAERIVEQQWTRLPHPDLLVAYRRARPVAEPLQWVKQVERLVRLSPLHRESLIALGVANLDAKLWGEARRLLAAAVEAGQGEPSAGLCRLMARLEEEEGVNPAAVRDWLARAAEAPPDPAWVCEACGAAHARWQGNCSRCGSFDKLVWRAPARVQPVLIKEAEPPRALLEGGRSAGDDQQPAAS
ncbi:MAG TPA: tetratricopeptide repeat protein, partial [Alphaproteobacteria bacterium]|nr:tetratricopeptide repeat protein [Alphaproteobacteria bacterium]